MNGMLQLNIISSPELARKNVVQQLDQATEINADFAALLMALMVPQALDTPVANVDQAGEIQLQNIAPGQFLPLPDELSSIGNLPHADNGQNLKEGHSIPQTLSMVDFPQAFAVKAEGKTEEPLLNDLNQPFVEVGEQELPTTLKQQEDLARPAPDIKNKDRIQDDIKLNKGEVIDLQETKQFDEIMWQKQSIQQKEVTQDLDQKFNWWSEGGSARLSAVEPLNISAKEATLPKSFDVVVEQLVEKSKLTLGQGKSQVEIKLKPEYLGKVQLRISFEEGILTAKFAVESHAVGKMLESNLSQFKDSMQEQGLNFSQVNVEVGNGTLDQKPQEFLNNFQQQYGRLAGETKPEREVENLNSISTSLSGVNYLA